MKVLALTVSDRQFFVGTLAAVNSLLHYTANWPDDWTLDIAVVSSGQYNQPLTGPQIELLQHPKITVYKHTDFDGDNRSLGAWQLKAYAPYDLTTAKQYDLVIGFDSDMLFASDVRDVIQQCVADGKFRGGKDGDGARYTSEYEPYGIKAGAIGPYMSTSCYFCPITPTNKTILAEWAQKTNTAKYGPQATKTYAGHGDQGVLNAVIYAVTQAQNVELLPNELWSQHWRYEKDIIEWDGAELINYSAGKKPMRALHCGGSDKFWSVRHSEKRLDGGQSQRWSYAHFLRFLHFGVLSNWTNDPLLVIPAELGHVLSDALYYHQLILTMAPELYAAWDNLPPRWLDRALSSQKIHRMMTILPDGNGSMDQYIRLARSLPDRATLVEAGSYHGGSAITVAAATAHKRLHVISVESFTGNLNNTVDGHALPSLKTYAKQIKELWPFVNVDAIQLPGQLAAAQFPDNSLDMVFVDGDHSTPAVLRDIDVWWPKIKPGGLIVGDDYNWASVAAAVNTRFPTAENKSSVWWMRKP